MLPSRLVHVLRLGMANRVMAQGKVSPIAGTSPLLLPHANIFTDRFNNIEDYESKRKLRRLLVTNPKRFTERIRAAYQENGIKFIFKVGERSN